MGHMTGTPTWTILVPTLGERRPLFERLMAALLPQLDPYGGAVRVLAWCSNGKPGLPEIRQRLIEAASGEYVSSIDDDDLVPDDYVLEIMAALTDRPDYVGFQVQCYTDGVPTGISHHSLEHIGWVNEDRVYFRDLSHLNPIRRELALLADFRKTTPGQPEDRAWVAQLRRSGQVRTQVMIPRIMYHYLFSTSRTAGIGSRWKAPRLIRNGHRPAEINHPFFTYAPECRNA
jgi:Glycosyl transferase family 2